MMDRPLGAFFEFAGLCVGGICAGCFMNGSTEFIWAWTIGGAVAGFFIGMASAAITRAIIYRFFENEWPTLH